MTQEAYVSFETAKLLKEKGFEIDTHHAYWKVGADGTMYRISPIGAYTSDPNDKTAFYVPADTFPCPTQQMATRWLREEKDMRIGIDAHLEINPATRDKYLASIRWKTKNGFWMREWLAGDTYEDACEKALLYGLNKLPFSLDWTTSKI